MRAQDHLVLYCKLRTIAGSGSSGISTAQSNSAVTPAQLQEILSRLAETYFTFSGSVTAGLRVVVGRLNDFLLNRNLKAAQEGQTVGTLNLAVIHGNRLVVAHLGTTHSFVLTKNEVLHFDDGQAGRGLGLSRQIMPRFYQTALETGDLLVLCADPPAAWNTKMLANSPQLSFDHLRRRLSSNAGLELQFGIIRFQTGKGQISFWRPGEAVHAAERPAEKPAGRPAGQRQRPAHPVQPKEVAAYPEPTDERQTAVDRMPDALEEAESEPHETENTPALEINSPTPDQELSYSVPELHDEIPTQPEEGAAVFEGEPVQDEAEKSAAHPGVFLGETVAAHGAEPAASVSTPLVRPVRGTHAAQSLERQTETAAAAAQSRTTRRSEQTKSVLQKPKARRAPVVRSTPRKPGALQTGLAAVGGKIKLALLRTAQFLSKISSTVSGTLARAVPRQVDAQGRVIPFFNLSSAQMIAIAIFVPLIVVAVGTTVYVRSGLSEQFLGILADAQRYAQQAAQQQDPVLQRESWKQAYTLLLEAEKLKTSDESQALKKQAIKALDDLEGYVRLDYQPAVSGGFPPDVSITRMVTTLNDVYLLDSSQGRILRLYRTASSYEVDPKFNCGAGSAGTIIINPLIDLVALPPNNEMHSTVMGIDAGGNLVYCAPNLTGFDSRPLALPDSGWGNIVGITLYGNTLYVLDPKANAVYRFEGADGVFTERPHLYFDNDIPQMGDVVDLAVDQEFLYMLHADGRMTVCESSGFAFAATKCTDPAPYGDSRPGYDPAPLAFPGSRFTHIQTTQPPDPSLFALDAANKAIYHLSLRRLNLQRQYRSVVDANFPLPNEAASAFAVAPNRRVLIAFGNKVFFAPFP